MPSRSSAGGRRSRRARLLLLLLAGLVAGCERELPRTAVPRVTTQPVVRGPRDTLVELTRLRDARRYQALPNHVVAGHGRALADTLRAVDDFLAANRRLGAWLETHAGLGIAETVDQSYLIDDVGTYLGGSLGVFSRDVEFLDEVADGATATVSFLVAGRLPAQRARLVHTDDGWHYDPQTPLPPSLADAFHDMARGLDELHAELASGKIDAAAVRRDPDGFVSKVQGQLRRGVRMLSEAAATRQNAAATGPARAPAP